MVVDNLCNEASHERKGGCAVCIHGCDTLEARKTDRVWIALASLLDRTARIDTMRRLMGAWSQVVTEGRQQRRDALFDAMGSQMRASKRRCTMMERYVAQTPVWCFLVVWHETTQLIRQRRKLLAATGLACERRDRGSDALLTLCLFQTWRFVRELRQVGSLERPSHVDGYAIDYQCEGLCSNRSWALQPLEDLHSHSVSLQHEASDCNSFALVGETSLSQSTRSWPLGKQSGSQVDKQKHPRPEQACGLVDGGSSGNGGVLNIDVPSSADGSPGLAKQCQQRVHDSQAPQGCEKKGGRNHLAPRARRHTTIGAVQLPSSHQVEERGSEVQDSRREQLPRGPERFFYDTSSYTGCARYTGRASGTERSLRAERPLPFR